jgi:hypothetical protein
MKTPMLEESLDIRHWRLPFPHCRAERLKAFAIGNSEIAIGLPFQALLVILLLQMKV